MQLYHPAFQNHLGPNPPRRSTYALQHIAPCLYFNVKVLTSKTPLQIAGQTIPFLFNLLSVSKKNPI